MAETTPPPYPELPPVKYMLIKQADAQELLDYLATCPCGQVYKHVTVLLNLIEPPSMPRPEPNPVMEPF